jgi:hypothetical protein
MKSIPLSMRSAAPRWARKETAGPFAEILFAVEGH